eukprot:TRINITY_DN22664_c0_g1_i1.p1 TRINITY_DN22664_c0_g1~~TRINITY_DN22664_c0_g1_i1.p1  ORF type:complete len:189 (+),score=20.07 TRINITY_DN22664_c0_g1_i1:25-591(+)
MVGRVIAPAIAAKLPVRFAHSGGSSGYSIVECSVVSCFGKTSVRHSLPISSPRGPTTSRRALVPCGPRSTVRAGFARVEVLVQKVSATELNHILVNERTQPLVVDFYATWCGPCILLAQELEMLAVQYGEDVRFLKVDTDEEYELAHQMQVRGLPTLIFVSKDPEKHAIRVEGLMPSQVLRDIIEKEL